MYKILTDQNKLLGYAAQPNYIKKTTGGYVPCVPVEAVGLNFKGVVYNLLGHSDFEEAGTAYASMVTDAELNQMKESSEQQTTDLQLALVDVYEQALTVQQSNEQQTTDLQLAVVELYEAMLASSGSEETPTEPTTEGGEE